MPEPFAALQATDPVGEGGHHGSVVMAVEQIAELGVAGDVLDAEGGREVVGLEFALEATLELKERPVLVENKTAALR